MADTIRLNFAPPKFMIRRFPVPRKLGNVFFEMPAGSQLIGIDAPDADPSAVVFFWAVPQDDERPKIRTKYLIVEEGQPFSVEECSGVVELDDGTVMEEIHVHLQAVGFWNEVDEDDGSVRTVHVLELIDDDAEAETVDDSQ